MINFSSNCLESAFARISMTLPTSIFTTKTSNIEETNDTMQSLELLDANFKRRHSIEDNQLPHKKFMKDNKTSPILDSCEKMRLVKISYDKTKKFPEKRNIIKHFRGNGESPPFYGFDNSVETKSKEIEKEFTSIEPIQDVVVNTSKLENVTKTEVKTDSITIRRNGNRLVEDEIYQKKLLQEKADLELAKKLQKEFDKYAHYTRSSRKVGRGSIHRQTTLDQILTGPYRVK